MRRQSLESGDKQLLISALRDDLRVTEDLTLRNNVAAHKDLRGRYFKRVEEDWTNLFPSQTYYYFVISHKSRIPGRLSVLRFPDFPYYWYDYNQGGSRGAYYLGEFKLLGALEVDDVWWSDFRDMEEIGREEYEAAMDRYVARLKQMKWDPNHNKFGGHWPHEPEWAPVP